MDNLNSGNSISSIGTTGDTIGNTSISGTNTGVFSFISKISIFTWIIIIFIFAFLGFNIFAYLAKGTEDITNFFNPILKKVFGVTLLATGEAVNLTAEGAKTVVNTTANVVDSGLTAVQELTPQGNRAESSIHGAPQNTSSQQPDIMANNSLNKQLNTNASQQQGQMSEFQAHEASSSINTTGQVGWCYIGEDRGYRTCAQVSASDKCMSGDIFPSQEICINPSLRP
jgi:hypothetical protein